jgi:hypothetical protein
MPCAVDPLPTVVSFDKVFQLLHWPIKMIVREGKSIIFRNLVSSIVTPLLSRPFRHVLGWSVGLDVGERNARESAQECQKKRVEGEIGFAGHGPEDVRVLGNSNSLLKVSVNSPVAVLTTK